MKPILILFATREGHTHRIAEHLAGTIRSRGGAAEVVNAASLPVGFSLDAYRAALVAASVHLGNHEKEMLRFVKHHREELERLPAVFLSVSLSEATVEDANASMERRAEATADVNKMIEAFLKETGWRPEKIKAVAGALMFTRYNFLIRLVMKRIARAAGVSTDMSCDQEFTDWAALDRLAGELLEQSPVGALR